MSIISRVDKEKGITLAMWDGAVTEEKMLANLRKLVADPDWPAKRRLYLSDLRTISVYITIDVTSIKKVLAFLRKFPNKMANVKMAIVTNEVCQISNFFQRLMSKYPLTGTAFNSLDPPCTWLNINAEESERACSNCEPRPVGAPIPRGKPTTGIIRSGGSRTFDRDPIRMGNFFPSKNV